MAELIGADEDNFPFVVSVSRNEMVMLWNKFSGIIAFCNEDPVMNYAIIQYLKNNAYPQFGSIEEAEKYSLDHNWPRKNL